MIRFLTSIKIEEYQKFDIDFDYIIRDRFNPNKWNMQIVKNTPWDYLLLREFQEALQNINYPYNLRFSYLEKPTAEDALLLFPDWYQTLYRVPSAYDISIKNSDTLIFYFENKEMIAQSNEVVTSFKDFLDNFISYEVNIECEIKEVEKEIVVSERKKNKITKTAVNSADVFIENDLDASSLSVDARNEYEESEKEKEYDIESIESEHKEETKIVEDTILKEMQRNFEIMQKERERARLNRRGNYTYVELIDSIDTSVGNVDFTGKVFSCESKEFGGNVRLNVGVYDNAGGAIYVNIYESSQLEGKNLVRGQNVRVKGAVYIDSFSKDLTIKGHSIVLLPPDEPREDTYEKKRVELHLHSQMSVQDGVGSMMQYCKLAKSMGHTAIAITDHGVVQGYPDAQAAAKETGIKMLYGSELYVVEDKQTYIFNPSNVRLNSATFVVLDLETTGLSTYYDRIIEFGAVRVEKGFVTASMDLFINPERPIPSKISKLTSIADEMVKYEPTIEQCIDKILDFIGDAILVTHNASFDFGFIQEALKRMGRDILYNPVIDTLPLSRYLFPNSRRHNLGALCRNMEIIYDEDEAHRADYDARVLNDVWQPMLVKLTKSNFNMTHAELGMLETPIELLKHIRPIHVTVLAKNKRGLRDLYELVSIGHIKYYSDVYKVPLVPRSELIRLRENLIVGSACFNGEVFLTARNYNYDRLKFSHLRIIHI